ncbi:MAG: hypothetical protein IPK52_07090 [Chloroflexi bacterium]|nr:hypothetical protein [Chloroflexota bacterium]
MMLSDTPVTADLPIVCSPNALTAEQMERWMVVGKQMYQAIQEIRELPNGYAFRLPNDSATLMIIAEDLSMERLCCPFLRFTLEIEPAGGPFWLSFTGGEGSKEFLRFSFEEASVLDAEVATAAGFNLSASKELDSIETAIALTNVINERYANAADSKED